MGDKDAARAADKKKLLRGNISSLSILISLSRFFFMATLSGMIRRQEQTRDKIGLRDERPVLRPSPRRLF